MNTPIAWIPVNFALDGQLNFSRYGVFLWICLLEILHSECEQSWIAQGQYMPVPLHKLYRCLPRFQWKSSRKFLSRWIWTVQGHLCFRTSWVYPSQEWVSIHYEASFPSLLPLQRQYKEQEKMVLIVDQCISAATKATDKGYLIHWVRLPLWTRKENHSKAFPSKSPTHCQHHPLNHQEDRPPPSH